MQTMDQTALSVVVVRSEKAAVEIISERLFAFGASAVAENDADTHGGPPGEGSVVEGDVDVEGPVVEVGVVAEHGFDGADVGVGMVELTADILSRHLPDLSMVIGRLSAGGTICAFEVIVAGTAWCDAWKEHARVWTAGRFVIRPPWLDAGSPGTRVAEPACAGGGLPWGQGDQIELVVDPADTFGSGSHPTTRACLALLPAALEAADSGNLADLSVLDVGVGSGILAVAALKLGAGTATGIDIDQQALLQSAEVARVNGVGDRYGASVGDLAAVAESHDVVLANLLINVIEELNTDLIRATALGGQLIVSGLLISHRERALAALSPLTPVQECELGGWLAIRLSKPAKGEVSEGKSGRRESLTHEEPLRNP